MNVKHIEKTEKNKLKQIVKDHPNLETFLNDFSEDEKYKDLKEFLVPAINDMFNKIRAQSVMSGWYAHCLYCVTEAKKCSTVEDVISVFEKEAKLSRKRLGIKSLEIDSNT